MKDDAVNNGKDASAKNPAGMPDCMRCRHFKITWEPAFPRACLMFGLKCRNLPSTEVFLSTGKHCFAFEEKKKLPNTANNHE